MVAWKTGPGLRVYSGAKPQSGGVNEENHKMSRWRQVVTELVEISSPWRFNYDGVQTIAQELSFGAPTHLSPVQRQEFASAGSRSGGSCVYAPHYQTAWARNALWYADMIRMAV